MRPLHERRTRVHQELEDPRTTSSRQKKWWFEGVSSGGSQNIITSSHMTGTHTSRTAGAVWRVSAVASRLPAAHSHRYSEEALTVRCPSLESVKKKEK